MSRGSVLARAEEVLRGIDAAKLGRASARCIAGSFRRGERRRTKVVGRRAWERREARRSDGRAVVGGDWVQTSSVCALTRVRIVLRHRPARSTEFILALAVHYPSAQPWLEEDSLVEWPIEVVDLPALMSPLEDRQQHRPWVQRDRISCLEAIVDNDNVVMWTLLEVLQERLAGLGRGE